MADYTWGRTITYNDSDGNKVAAAPTPSAAAYGLIFNDTAPFITEASLGAADIIISGKTGVYYAAIGTDVDYDRVQFHFHTTDADQDDDSAEGELLPIQDGIDTISGSIPSLALEATLTAIKGAAWSDETLVEIKNSITSGAITTEDVWTYLYRTLTPSNIESTSEPNISDTPVDIYTYSSTTISTKCTDADEVWFTVKKNIDDSDLESLIQVSKTGSLLYINGQSASTAGLSASDATLTIVNGYAQTFISGSAAPSLLGTKEKNYTGEVKRRMNTGAMPIVAQFPVTLKGGLTQAL